MGYNSTHPTPPATSLPNSHKELERSAVAIRGLDLGVLITLGGIIFGAGAWVSKLQSDLGAAQDEIEQLKSNAPSDIDDQISSKVTELIPTNLEQRLEKSGNDARIATETAASNSEKLSEAQSKLEQLTRELSEIKPSLSAAEAVLPNGAVIAFDSTRIDAETCPPGWRPFKEARARVIVGAGPPRGAPQKYGFDEKGKALEGYVLRQHGGEEKSELTENELPSHTHTLNMDSVERGGHGAVGQELSVGDATDRGIYTPTGKIGKTGNGASFTNMPPFIALYFCKYDSVG